MGTSNMRHHQASLKAPVLDALAFLQAHIVVLAREGPEAYVAAVRSNLPHAADPDLQERIRLAVADAIEAYILED